MARAARAGYNEKCVRFSGCSDPAASYRTLDPYLAGARYQRLLRVLSVSHNAEGACRSHVRERAAGPRPMKHGFQAPRELKVGFSRKWLISLSSFQIALSLSGI